MTLSRANFTPSGMFIGLINVRGHYTVRAPGCKFTPPSPFLSRELAGFSCLGDSWDDSAGAVFQANDAVITGPDWDINRTLCRPFGGDCRHETSLGFVRFVAGRRSGLSHVVIGP